MDGSTDVSLRWDEVMSAGVVERISRRPMTFEDYLALPEGTRAEYVNGEALMSPAPRSSHQRVSRRIANVLDECLDVYVVEAVGVWTGERRTRIPDVLATSAPFDDSWAPEPPVLVVEVLSPSTRSEDTLRKSREYGDAGIGHYWLVDPDSRALTVLRNSCAEWEILLELDDTHPEGKVEVAGHGEVTLDLTSLLAT